MLCHVSKKNNIFSLGCNKSILLHDIYRYISLIVGKNVIRTWGEKRTLCVDECWGTKTFFLILCNIMYFFLSFVICHKEHKLYR